MIARTAQDPAVEGLRQRLSEMRDQRDNAVREAAEARELLEHADRQRTRAETERDEVQLVLAEAHTALRATTNNRDDLARTVRDIRPLADSWHRIGDLIDQWLDGADPHDTLNAIAEQVGER